MKKQMSQGLPPHLLYNAEKWLNISLFVNNKNKKKMIFVVYKQ